MTSNDGATNSQKSDHTNLYDRHLSQCIRLKHDYLHSQSTSKDLSVLPGESGSKNRHTNGCQDKANDPSPLPRDASKTSLSSGDHLCSRMAGYGSDIIFADQSGSDVLVNSPIVCQTSLNNSENICPCGSCPSQSGSNLSRQSHSGMLSDLQQSVSASSKKCPCKGCSKENIPLNRNVNANETPQESPSSGVIFCECCHKQKISVSNFRALQIANRLNLADQGGKISDQNHPNNNSYFEDDLCKRIDLLSLNMDTDIETKMKSAYSMAGLPGTHDSNNRQNIKTHGRHSSDSVFDHSRSHQSFDSIMSPTSNHSDGNSGGIDLSQFCVCELESDAEPRRKTSSSVDEIFNLSVAEGNIKISRNSNPVELHGRDRERLDGSSQRQRSLSDSQRDKAKVDSTSKCHNIFWLALNL